MKNTLFFMLSLSVLCSGCDNGRTPKEAPVLNVKTEKVTLSSAHSTVRYVGQIEEEACTSVSFKLSGTVEHVYVEEGQHVNAGDVIAVMDDVSMRNAFRSAEALWIQAKDAYTRMEKLHDRKSLPEIQWVETQSRLQQAEAAYENARKNLSDCRLTAPFSGIIGSCPVEAGETVVPAQPVALLFDIKTVKVKVAVPEKEIQHISSDSECVVEVAALGSGSFKSKRITKNVKSDLSTHTYDIWVHLDNPEGCLLPGMICDVSFPDNGTEEITVPVTSVYSGQGGSLFVWVAINGEARQIPVQTGRTIGSRIIITKGLKAGDMVITSGGQKLSVGTKVSAR